jgi:hypothetical protein
MSAGGFTKNSDDPVGTDGRTRGSILSTYFVDAGAAELFA